MKQSLIIGFLLITLYSQANVSANEDSLRNLIEESSDPGIRARLFEQLGAIAEHSEPKKAIGFYKEMLEEAERAGDNYLVSKAYNDIGMVWHNENNIPTSTEVFFLALERLDSVPKHFDLICRINNNIAANFRKQEDYERALIYYDIAERYALLAKSDIQLADIMNSKGVVYRNLSQHDKALLELTKSKYVNEKLDDEQRVLNTINNIGLVYLEQHQYTHALEHFQQALKANYQRKNMSKAAESLHHIGTTLHRQGNSRRAYDTLLSALKIADALQILPLQRDVSLALYEISQERKLYKAAIKYLNDYNRLNDSLADQDQYTALVELEAQYKVTQQERELQSSQNKLLHQKFITTLILSILGISILGIVFLIRINVIKKNNERALLKLNSEIDEMNKNLEMIILERTKTIQNQNHRLKEFAFLNSHRIRKPVSSILGLIDVFKTEINKTNHPELSDLSAMITDAAKELDNTIHEINEQLQEKEAVKR